MAYISGTSCCGLREIASIHSPWTRGLDNTLEALTKAFFLEQERFVKDEKNRMVSRPRERKWRPACCQLVFTDHHNFFLHKKRVRYGKVLAKYILKNKLGKLTCSTPAQNPNTGHLITVWVWTFDSAALEKHLDERFPMFIQPDPVIPEPPKVVPPTPSLTPAEKPQPGVGEIKMGVVTNRMAYLTPTIEEAQPQPENAAARQLSSGNPFPTPEASGQGADEIRNIASNYAEFNAAERRAIRRAVSMGRPMPLWATERLRRYST